MFARTKSLLAVLTALLSVFVAGLAGLAVPASASAPPPRPNGHIVKTLQHRNASITVTGYVYDRSHPRRSITACIAVRGTCQRRVLANLSSKRFDRNHRITGAHGFTVHIGRQRPGVRVQLRSKSGPATVLDSAWVLAPGTRVVRLAKRYVGNTPYVYGAASPQRGFDCSGYALYSYRRARVSSLPHNAEAQRHVRHMHLIRRSNARPGDLVFYLAGGSAYHVAIYAGHGMQYSAADPSDGIRYQRIWSSNVEYRTNWH